jgi:hypothetical protein
MLYVIADVLADGSATRFWSSKEADSHGEAIERYAADLSRGHKNNSSHSTRFWSEDTVRFAVAPVAAEHIFVRLSDIQFYDVSRVEQPSYEVKRVGR